MFRQLQVEILEPRQMLAPVVSAVETPTAGGAADDITIWIHPTDPAESRVIGAIKSGGSAIEVYRLDGTRVQTITSGDINNVDLRYNFPLAGESVTLMAGTNRANDSIVLYRIDATGTFANVAVRTITTGIDVYGCSMYVSPHSGKYYVFVSSEGGQVLQWELSDAGGGKVDATRVREFDVGRITEGLAADDVTGYLYAAEEDVGIWRYSAEPGGGAARTQIDATGGSGHLNADVEGLAIYYRPDGEGYLIASSQGSNDFVVYDRKAGNSFIGRFNLVAGGGIDAVADTDGIDVTNFPLGSVFPGGLFVAQDSDANFKLVAWEEIAVAIGAEVDITWDPRQVGARGPSPSSRGDFNNDGVVDAADYTVWRNRLGNSVLAHTSADANGDGLVGVEDYAIWKSHFGTVLSVDRALQLDEPDAETETLPVRPWALSDNWKTLRRLQWEASYEEAYRETSDAITRSRLLLVPIAPVSRFAVPGRPSSTTDSDGGSASFRQEEAADAAWSEWGTIDAVWRLPV